MRLNEAIAIYLYLQRHEAQAGWNAALLRKVTEIIDHEADKAIKRDQLPENKP